MLFFQKNISNEAAFSIYIALHQYKEQQRVRIPYTHKCYTLLLNKIERQS